MNTSPKLRVGWPTLILLSMTLPLAFDPGAFAPGFLAAARAAAGDFRESMVEPWHVTGRSAHQNVWECATAEPTQASPEPTRRVHRYVELATGLNTLDAGGQWVAATTEFTLQPGRAAALGTAHKVYLAADIGTEGHVVQQVGVFESTNTSYFTPIDSREFHLPANGVYLVWNLAGHKVLRIARADLVEGNRATVSGLFFGPAN